MPFDNQFDYTAALAAIFSIATAVYVFKGRSRLPYPPGPAGVPILGNFFDIPKTNQTEAYREIGRNLGSPIIHLNILGTHIVSVNDMKVARNLFERPGAPYCNRPAFPMAEKVAGHDFNFGFYNYDNVLKTCRRYTEMRLRPNETRQFRHLSTRSARKILIRMLQRPAEFANHCRFFACSIILDIVYGITVTDSHGPLIRIIEDALHGVNETTNYPIAEALHWAIKYLPGWLPGMEWKRKSKKWRASNHQMRDIPFEMMRKALKDNTALPSVVAQLFEVQNEDIYLTDDIIKTIGGTLIVGGLDTGVSVLLSTILMLRTHPNVQRAAQAELDKVLGHARLPEFTDKPQLPFIEAFVKEIIRYTCPVPACLPHCPTVDDIWEYEGKKYLIPKGAVVIPNAWAMTRDPDIYPNPEEFNPWRFLKEDGSFNSAMQDPTMVFGFRPRNCPGKILAEDNLFIFAASFISTFQVEPEPGSSPVSSDFDSLYEPGLVVYPQSFDCKISPRSQKAESIVLNVDTEA